MKPHQKLADSLKLLQELQKNGRRVFQSSQLSRVHRERLIKNGFLREVIKGWFISSSPSTRDGDSTPWYASYWEFCARYSQDRFGDKWHLSPQQSLLLHAEKTVVPTQVVIYSPMGTNHTTDLIFGTSLYDLKSPEVLSAAQLSLREELRLFSPAAALVRVPEGFFRQNPIEAQVVLASISEPSDVLRPLLEGGHSVKAGQIAGALRRIGRGNVADEIVKTMEAAGFNIREVDPFTAEQKFLASHTATEPIIRRVWALWESMRETVVETSPKPPGLPSNRAEYLRSVEDLYKSDAYHSLSIEGYSVTPDLIERVREGDWNPELHEADRHNRDGLAARGYWQAFQKVKEAVGKVISGENPGRLARSAHGEWYRELFQPCVAAALINPSALAGYRDNAVYLSGSRYVPPRWEAVRSAMPELFNLLEREQHPFVRAVLGHWLFGYVHPYPDGNGRMARFLMNLMLASGGFPWTVIQVEDREEYLAALDAASIDANIKCFAGFVAERVRRAVRQVGVRQDQ